MNLGVRHSSLWLLLTVAAVYCVAGVGFAALAASADTHRWVVVWRLAAWLVSAIAFAVQIALEHARHRDRPLATASLAALAVAGGAFGLAAAANVHALRAGTGNHVLLGIALVAWPLGTAVPAFAVSWVAATVLRHLQNRS